VDRYLDFLGDREPSPPNAREFVEKLAENNSSRSVGRHIYALRDYFAHLGQELDLSAPSFPQRLPRWLNSEEWDKVLTTVEAPLLKDSAPDRAVRRALFRRAALMVYGGAVQRLPCFEPLIRTVRLGSQHSEQWRACGKLAVLGGLPVSPVKGPYQQGASVGHHVTETKGVAGHPVSTPAAVRMQPRR
jgi:hypothetical protein